MNTILPLFLFAACAALVPMAMLLVGVLVGPSRSGGVKRMPYESGMDPVHDTRRRFDVRFHLVAIAFVIFDVELLFIYPWAVASRNPEGISRAIGEQMVSGRGVVFGGVLFFLALLALGLLYEWRKGVLRWR